MAETLSRSKQVYWSICLMYVYVGAKTRYLKGYRKMPRVSS